MNREVISLSKFLSRFVSLNGKSLTAMTHDEVKILFPFIKRTTFDIVNAHEELLITGKAVLVTDGNKVIPYLVPVLSNDETEIHEVNREEVPKLVIDNNVYDYYHLSEYGLRQLLRRRFNSRSNQSHARRELNNRGIQITKKYKRNNNINMKEDE